MGGFCQLRVRQKTICKQHNIISYHKLLTTAGVAAARLADAVAWGSYYYGNMSINEKLFHSLVQHKMDCELKNLIYKFYTRPTFRKKYHDKLS